MKKLMHFILISAFAVYLFVLFYLLFGGTRVEWDVPFSVYVKHSVNLVPFHTIGEYLTRLSEHTINRNIVIINILGNIAALFPMGIFIPCIFPKMRKLWKIMLMVFVLIFVCECIQLILRVGAFDIDDFILNILGAAIAYGVWKIKPVNNLLRKLYLIC